MNPSMISLFSAMAAAVWSVWTWQSEREKVREQKRDEMSAQYVNSFIATTQELQRQLFRILEEDELAHYRSKYPQPVEPATPVAIELLYLLSAFFGWGLLTFRFGPYTRDPGMIALLAQIGDVWECRTRFPGDAFRFSLCERLAMGHAVVQRVGETSSGPAFVSISRFKFEEELEDERSEWVRLFRCEEVRCTMAAVDRAIRGEPLEGRERLAVLQNLLVDLVTYLEQQEGFRVSFGERGRAKIENGYWADVLSPDNTDVLVLHQVRGRIRLGIPHLHADKTYASHLQVLLQSLNHVKTIRVNVDAACVVIEYSAKIPLADFVREAVAKVENDLLRISGNENVQHPRVVVSPQPTARDATSMLN